jgi:tetratricopeptide (TPR) repeat protein
VSLGPGSTLGPYRLEAELGRGGMGAVYQATHVTLGRRVALKVLLEGSQASPARRERFLCEGRAAARLRHPNVVSVHDVAAEGDVLYLVLDFAPGESLAKLVGRDGPFDPAEAARIVAKLARAVYYAHSRNVLHRDLKPENVILSPGGEPLLTDFGLAKETDDPAGLTQSGRVLGTPGYLPPEQARGDLAHMGTHSDVFSLGATLYHLLVGSPPFRGDSLVEVLASVLGQDPVPPSQLVPGVGSDLDTICQRCMEKEPQDRYPSALELAEDLEHWVAGEPIKAKDPTLLDRIRRSARRHRRLVRQIGASGAALAIAALVGWAWVGHVRSQDALAAEQTQAEAKASVRDDLVGEARAALEEAPPTSLTALVAAARWHTLAPGDAGAVGARLETAAGLAAQARAAKAWSQGRAILGQVESLDRPRVALLQEELEREASVEVERRRAVAEATLRGVAAHGLENKREARRRAVIRLLLAAGPETPALLLARLHALIPALIAAQREVYSAVSEPRGPEVGGPLLHLPPALDALAAGALRPATAEQELALRRARQRLEQRGLRTMAAGKPYPRGWRLVANEQAARSGEGQLAQAAFCAAALGRLQLEDPEPVVATLRRLLAAVADPLVATPAVLALTRIEGGAQTALAATRDRFVFDRALRDRVSRRLRASDFEPELPAGPRGLHLRGVAWALLGELKRARADLDGAVAADPKHIEARRWRADVRAQDGDLEGALQDATAAARLEPYEHRHTLAVAGYLLKLKRESQALDALESLERESPEVRNDPSFLHTRATIFAQSALAKKDGQLKLAIALTDLNRAVKLDPSQPHSWLLRAQVYMVTRRTKSALASMGRALTLDPDNVAYLTMRGILHVERKDAPRALDDLGRAAALSPDAPLVRMFLAGALRRLGDFDTALREYERGQESCRSPNVVWLEIPGMEMSPRKVEGQLLENGARVRLALRQFDRALADAARALALDPKEHNFWALRAEIHWARGARAACITDYRKACEVANTPTKKQAHLLSISVAHYQSGDTAKAVKACEEALALDPSAARAHSRLGTMLRYTEPQRALASFTRALKLKPGLIEAYRRRAETYLRLDRKEEALADFREALRRSPKDARAAGGVVRVLLVAGKREEALRAAERAVKVSPLHPKTLGYRAMAKDSLGDREGAIADATKALKIDPRDAALYVLRGKCLSTLGRTKEARRDLKRSMELDPRGANSKTARKLLSKLDGS